MKTTKTLSYGSLKDLASKFVEQFGKMRDIAQPVTFPELNKPFLYDNIVAYHIVRNLAMPFLEEGVGRVDSAYKKLLAKYNLPLLSSDSAFLALQPIISCGIEPYDLSLYTEEGLEFIRAYGEDKFVELMEIIFDNEDMKDGGYKNYNTRRDVLKGVLELKNFIKARVESNSSYHHILHMVVSEEFTAPDTFKYRTLEDVEKMDENEVYNFFVLYMMVFRRAYLSIISRTTHLDKNKNADVFKANETLVDEMKGWGSELMAHFNNLTLRDELLEKFEKVICRSKYWDKNSNEDKELVMFAYLPALLAQYITSFAKGDEFARTLGLENTSSFRKKFSYCMKNNGEEYQNLFLGGLVGMGKSSAILVKSIDDEYEKLEKLTMSVVKKAESRTYSSGSRSSSSSEDDGWSVGSVVGAIACGLAVGYVAGVTYNYFKHDCSLGDAIDITNANIANTLGFGSGIRS